MDHTMIFLWVLLSAAGLNSATESPKEIYECGETFTDPSRSFSGPYYDGGGNIVDCRWTIISSDNKPIKLTIDFLDLDCTHEYIKIFAGKEYGSYMLGKICGGSAREYVSYAGILTFLLHRESHLYGTGFFAYYDIGEVGDFTSPSYPTETPEPTTEQTPEMTTELYQTTEGFRCGGILSEASGYIDSPYYPGDGQLMECIWEIQAPLYHYVVLRFHMVNANNCRNDYITIYDGNFISQLGKICMFTRHIFTSTSNTMTIVMHRNSYNRGPAFTAYYYTTLQETTIAPMQTTEGTTEPEITSIEVTTEPETTLAPMQTTEGTTEPEITTIEVTTEPETTLAPMQTTEGTTEPEATTGLLEATSSAIETTELTSAFAPETTELPSTPALLSSTVPSRTTKPATPLIPTLHPITNSSLPNGVCGGNLSLPSGSISGPYYSGNNASMQCTWEIEVSPDRQIILQFSYISLDCSDEYIEIFDGRLYSSAMLGRTCSDIYVSYPYISSSNKMTILLYRKSDLSGNGFHASYYSIPVEIANSTEQTPSEPTTAFVTRTASVPSRTLSCSEGYMRAGISKAYLRLLGYNMWDVYLNTSDSFCAPQMTPDYVVFRIPFSGCGTVRQQRKNDTIIYSNVIKTSTSGYIITRKSNFQFHITCEMNENTVVETMFVAQNAVDISEKKHGSYNVTLAFFESPSFYYQVNGSPYYVSLNQNLYLQATLHSSDPHLVLFLDTCVASPYSGDFTTLTHDLIRDGCVRDSTYRNLMKPRDNQVRFMFSSFKFVNEYNDVYLQCKFVVCKAHDYSSRCYQGCLTRTKREADELQEKVDVVVGPVKLQKDDNQDRKQELVKSVNLEKEEALSPLTVATVLLAAMVFVLSGFLLNSKLRRKNVHQVY